MTLSIQQLSKHYPNGVQALDQVDLTIGEGMFGLLGPNGAGKSTLMRTLATLQDPTEGEVWFGELDLLRNKDRVRQLLGYLPQEFGVYPNVKAETLLDHFAVLKGIRDKRTRRETVNHLLEQTNLAAYRKQKLGTFSGGMKQRFGIAQALLGDPQLIIVDEPTAGLDPAERNRFLNLLSEVGEDRVVILSTHIVEDVKELCSDMAIINGGQVLSKSDPVEAINAIQGNIWQKVIDKQEIPAYEDAYQVISSKLNAGKTELHVYSETHPGHGFKQVEADLEDVYFATIQQHKTKAVTAEAVPPESS